MERFNETERLGIYKSAIIFTEELKWVYREQPLVDVGIDALIEESVDGNPTGKLLAAQVKAGIGSFLSTGDGLILYVSRIHHNYWLKYDLPIILLAYIPEDDKVYWEIINAETLKATKKRWKLEISKNKRLGKSSKEELINIIYRKPQRDFLTQLKAGEVSEESLLELTKKSTYFNDSKDSLERLSEIASKYNEGRNNFIKDAEFCKENGFSKTHPKIKSIIKQFSNILELTSHQFEKEIDVFSDSFATAFREFEKLTIAHFYLFDDYEHVKLNFNRLGNLVIQLNNSLEAMKSFRNSISEFPNTYPQLKIAKKQMVETLDLMISEFKVAKEMNLNFQNALNKILN